MRKSYIDVSKVNSAKKLIYKINKDQFDLQIDEKYICSAKLISLKGDKITLFIFNDDETFWAKLIIDKSNLNNFKFRKLPISKIIFPEASIEFKRQSILDYNKIKKMLLKNNLKCLKSTYQWQMIFAHIKNMNWSL